MIRIRFNEVHSVAKRGRDREFNILLILLLDDFAQICS